MDPRIGWGVGFAVLLLAGTAHSTKPCPPPPCASEDAACWEREASWIAVGTVTDVERRPYGKPLMKDFADFVLRVKDWEKGPSDRQAKQLLMQVGWCNSPKQLPADTVGTFRFYGTRMATGPDEQGRLAVEFLTYLRVECPKAGGCNDAPIRIAPDAEPTSPAASRPPMEVPPASSASPDNFGSDVATRGEATLGAPAAALPPDPIASTPASASPHETSAGLGAEPEPTPRAAPGRSEPGRCGCRVAGGPRHASWCWILWLAGGLALALGRRAGRRTRTARRGGKRALEAVHQHGLTGAPLL